MPQRIPLGYKELEILHSTMYAIKRGVEQDRLDEDWIGEDAEERRRWNKLYEKIRVAYEEA